MAFSQLLRTILLYTQAKFAFAVNYDQESSLPRNPRDLEPLPPLVVEVSNNFHDVPFRPGTKVKLPCKAIGHPNAT